MRPVYRGLDNRNMVCFRFIQWELVNEEGVLQRNNCLILYFDDFLIHSMESQSYWISPLCRELRIKAAGFFFMFGLLRKKMFMSGFYLYI